MGGLSAMLLLFLALAIFGTGRRLGVLLLGSLFTGLLISIVMSVMMRGENPWVAVNASLFTLLIIIVLIPFFIVRLVRQRHLYFPQTNRRKARGNVGAIVFSGLLFLLAVTSVLGTMAKLAMQTQAG